MVVARVWLLIAAVAVLAAGGAVLYWSGTLRDAETNAPQPPASAAAPASGPETAAAPPASPQAAPEPATAEARDPNVPRFDIVRVEPTGEAVIAGRAEPGATVELLRDATVHDRVVADQSGLFAFVPPAFPTGPSEITLRARTPDGTPRQSSESVTIVVSQDRKSAPVVALAAPGRPTVVLSTPAAAGEGGKAVAEGAPPEQPSSASATATAPTEAASAGATQPGGAAEPGRAGPAVAEIAGPAPRTPIRITSVDAETGGGLYVTGAGAPGATVRLYLNETFIAPGGADADGRVAFSIGRGVRPGDYRVRLDDVEPVTGAVKTRAEVGFTVPEAAPEQAVAAASPEADAAAPGRLATGVAPAATPAAAPAPRIGAVAVPEVNTAVVARGDSLWRISRRIYGAGMRYTVIYEANQEQIRSPQLIYPGQVFVLPAPDGEGGETR